MAALVKAVEDRRFLQIKLLIKNGYNVNRREKDQGRTALIAACQIQQREPSYALVKWLLKQGACQRYTDYQGMTAIMHACRCSNLRVISLLLQDPGLVLTVSDIKGDSVLNHAVRTGDIKILDPILNRFVKERLKLPQANNMGDTPLILAAKLGYQDCFERLMRDRAFSKYARDFEFKLIAKQWRDQDGERFDCREMADQNLQSLRSHRPNRIAEKPLLGLDVKNGIRGFSVCRKQSLDNENPTTVRNRKLGVATDIYHNNKVYPRKNISDRNPSSGKQKLPCSTFPSSSEVQKSDTQSAASDLWKVPLDDVQARRETSIKSRLPELYSALQAQKSSSYRLKAVPPPPKPIPVRSSSSFVLRRFVKAGFASIAYNKISFGSRRSRGSADSKRTRPSTPSPIRRRVSLMNYISGLTSQPGITSQSSGVTTQSSGSTDKDSAYRSKSSSIQG